RAQRMVDCLVDLVLRPGEHGLAPVQAQLTVVATVRTLLGDDEPGEVDGDLVPAEMVRELAYALGLLPRPAGEPVDIPEPADTAAPAPAEDLGTADASGPADLLGTRTLRGTALAHRPQIALADDLTGQLAALTDAAGLRAGRGLGPPPETPGYSPDAELDRFVRLRDRRCRFPGCRARARRDDLDHTVPWPAGPTNPANLAALCRHHHRLSHQAPGWRLRGLDDGGLQWTTPTGQVLVTHPPRHGADDDLSPPGQDPPHEPGTAAVPESPPDDPLPF
ncbi:MAG: putative endonuclease, partial [Modestobacter sp.]|nr:putative endonuclease [Modestobacter sp.]